MYLSVIFIFFLVLSLPGINQPCLMSYTLLWMGARCGWSFPKTGMLVEGFAQKKVVFLHSPLSSRNMAALPI